MAKPVLDDRCFAGIDLIKRTGATSFQIRYTDDEQPVVWMTVAAYNTDFGPAYKIGAGLRPEDAVRDLCDKAVDGGYCTHCHRRTAFAWDLAEDITGILPVCVYGWDPELKTFRRACEGEPDA